MDNKTICEFVNSKDIRSHLADIGYQFSSAEAAWLVDKCDHITLEERHAAWQDIIGTMPDCALDVGHRKNAKGGKNNSLHGILQKLIEIDQKHLADFYDNGGNAVYQYAINYRDINQLNYFDDSPLFSEYEHCLNDVKEELIRNSERDKRFGEKEEEIRFISIRKNYIENHIANLTLKLNADCKVISVRNDYVPDEEVFRLQNMLDDLWFCIPAPFKKGDIVWHKNRKCEAGPLVVKSITPDWCAEDGFEGTDSSDMNVCGYFQQDNGKLFYEVTENYMDFEYYPEEKLVGKRRILKALSNFLYGKIDVDLFCEAYQHILLEEYLKENSLFYYIEEKQRLAGLID